MSGGMNGTTNGTTNSMCEIEALIINFNCKKKL